MNTNDPSSNRRLGPAARWPALAIACLGLAMTTGCGYQFGALLYYLNLNPQDKVKAQFKLPPGPLLILVDDDMDLVQPPLAREALVDAVATQLREHKAADRVTTNEEIGLIRRSVPDFDKLSVSEVGRRASADTVIWMNVEDFYLEKDLQMMVTPARFAVKLKVFNPKEEDKYKKRIWPPEREGRAVDITVSPHDARRCKNRDEVHQLLAATMADKVAKLFYDYKVEKQ
jgi:hypothetical protein